MTICPRCYNVMKHVYRFTPESSCELDVCKKCYFETKPKKLKIDGIEITQDNTKHNVKKIEVNKKHNKKSNKKHKKGKKR